jgi:probable rRNA maturation factor
MEIILEFNNKEKGVVKKTFLLAVVRKTLAKSGLAFLDGKKVSVSFAAVDEEEMKKLNAVYRRKNSATDVLSFCEYRKRKEISQAGDNVFLGEVVLCYNYIEKYSQKNRALARIELARSVSHGLLHLLGFRHGRKMFEIQDEAAGQIG